MQKYNWFAYTFALTGEYDQTDQCDDYHHLVNPINKMNNTEKLRATIAIAS